MWNIAPIAHALWHRKTGALLIATQVALTLAILCNALGVVLDRRDQSTRPTGTDEDNLIFLQVITPGYDDDAFGTQRAAEALLRAVPGVREAAWVNQVPLSNSGSSSGMSSEDGKTRFLNSAHYSTGGSLVQSFGLQLVQGRDFTPDEYAELDLRRSRQPPTQAMVTRALAEELYPGEASVVGPPHALGHRRGRPGGHHHRRRGPARRPLGPGRVAGRRPLRRTCLHHRRAHQ